MGMVGKLLFSFPTIPIASTAIHTLRACNKMSISSYTNEVGRIVLSVVKSVARCTWHGRSPEKTSPFGVRTDLAPWPGKQGSRWLGPHRMGGVMVGLVIASEAELSDGDNKFRG